MSLPTLDDLAAYLDQLGEGDMEKVAPFLERAIVIVQREVGRQIGVIGFEFNPAPEPTTIRVKTYGRTSVPLPAPVMGSVALVEYESGFNLWTELDANYYAVRDGAVLLDFVWPSNLNLRITAPFGFGDCPEDVAEVILELTVNMWRSKETGGFVTQIGESGSSYQKVVSGLTKMQLSILQAYTDQYRNVVI